LKDAHCLITSTMPRVQSLGIQDTSFVEMTMASSGSAYTSSQTRNTNCESVGVYGTPVPK
jgi:hypothetical protein